MQQTDTEQISIDDFHLSGVHFPFALEATQNLTTDNQPQDATVGPAMALFKEDDSLFNFTLPDSEPNFFSLDSSFDDFIHSNDPPPFPITGADLFSFDITDGTTTNPDYTNPQQKTENTITETETEMERSLSQYSLPSQGGSDFTDFDNASSLPSDFLDQFTIDGPLPFHIVSQFCQFGSDQNELNSLWWFERKMRNGNLLTTNIQCAINMNRLDGGEFCTGTCLATMELGCLIPDCPVKAGIFNSEQDLYAHIQEHINPPSSTELNFDNLERLLSYKNLPSPNPSLSQLSVITSKNTTYSTSSLANSPYTRWNQVNQHLAASQTGSSIAATASPTLSHRALSENSCDSHSANGSTKNTSRSHSTRKRRSPKPITDAGKKKEELLCGYPTCTRSQKGNGFARSDNLLNHRRHVHDENTPKLPKGRKKRVV